MLRFIVLALLSVAVTGSRVERENLAPLYKPQNIVPDSYIVKFKDGISATSFDNTLASFVDKSYHVFENGFKGFAAKLDASAIRNLRRHPDVRAIFISNMYNHRLTCKG